MDRNGLTAGAGADIIRDRQGRDDDRRGGDIDKRPNRLRVERNGDVGRIAERPEVRDQLRDLRRVRDADEYVNRWDRLRDREDITNDPIIRRVGLNRVSGAFQSRLHRGDLNDWDDVRIINRSRFVQRIDIDINRQYNLYRRGDVGRQLGFHTRLVDRGGWRNRFHGPIWGGYTRNSFSIWYPGPRWYPRAVWHPRWDNWVAWSWWSTPIVLYDPRPVFVRPIFYDPCPVWEHWDYPQWQPLPVVTAGTWVDVPTVEVPPERIDLQLLAVRFVDPGHPDEAIGPRYRVWLRNNSNVDLAERFNVMLLASADTHADASLPQSGVTVDRIEAGETQAVDVRLPFEALRIAENDQGKPIPFQYLHALVDSHRNLEEHDEANNGALLDAGDILPVDPAAFSTDIPAAAPGDVVTVAGEGFGPEPGQIIISVAGQDQQVEVQGWYDLGIRFQLPEFQVNAATDVTLIVIRGDGAASNPIAMQMAPEELLSDATPPAPAP